MAITTSSSMSVNPGLRELRVMKDLLEKDKDVNVAQHPVPWTVELSSAGKSQLA